MAASSETVFTVTGVVAAPRRRHYPQVASKPAASHDRGHQAYPAPPRAQQPRTSPGNRRHSHDTTARQISLGHGTPLRGQDNPEGSQ